jgi:hypothetical protein
MDARTRTLGLDHPDTHSAVNNLANNLDDQGRYDEAEPLLLQVRVISLGWKR